MRTKYEKMPRAPSPPHLAVVYGHPWCFPIVCPCNMGHLRVSDRICIENWYVYRYLSIRHRPLPYKPPYKFKTRSWRDTQPT